MHHRPSHLMHSSLFFLLFYYSKKNRKKNFMFWLNWYASIDFVKTSCIFFSICVLCKLFIFFLSLYLYYKYQHNNKKKLSLFLFQYNFVRSSENKLTIKVHSLLVGLLNLLIGVQFKFISTSKKKVSSQEEKKTKINNQKNLEVISLNAKIQLFFFPSTRTGVGINNFEIKKNHNLKYCVLLVFAHFWFFSLRLQI